MQHREQVIIGVDPHKLSATIEVVDQREQLLGSGRFTTDRTGYAAMRTYAKAWPVRVWAVEGANGVGRPLAQRLLEAGEQVVEEKAPVLRAYLKRWKVEVGAFFDGVGPDSSEEIRAIAVKHPAFEVLPLD